MAKIVNSDNLARFKDKMQEVIDAGDAVSVDVSVELGSGGSLGGYKTGDTITAGTPIETVIKKLLAKQIPPTYIQPSVSISNNGGTAAGSYEIGTTITPKMQVSYIQNDGGVATGVTLTKAGVNVAEAASAPLIYEEESFILGTSVSYKGTVTYEEGAIKNDNLGEAYSMGHITAGSKSSSNYTFTPYRQGYFWGVLATTSEEAPLDSTIIRNSHMKNGTFSSGNITGIAASEVSNRKRIFVACPATNTGVTKVIMPSAMNADCTADWKLLDDTVMVEGANGYTATPYKVWVYEPAAISDDQTFTITLTN